MNFRVGQKVTLTAPVPWRRDNREIVPQFGVVYTVRNFSKSGAGKECLRLVEIVNSPHLYSEGVVECAFSAHRFRPVVDTTKQVEAIKSLIKPIFEGKTVELVQ